MKESPAMNPAIFATLDDAQIARVAAFGMELHAAAGEILFEQGDAERGLFVVLNGSIEIISGDRDLFALIEDGRVAVLYPEKGGWNIVDEAEVTRRYGIPGRHYADFAMLRGDPSDGLPGLKGVGAVAAASMIREHGGIEALIAAGRLSEANRDYLTRAMKVVPPVADLPIDVPAGRRDRYPADPAQLNALMATHGLQAASARLVEALNTHLLA